MHKTLYKAVFFCLAVTLFASCDKDFNEIGSDIVGDDHYGFNRDSLSVTVKAYNQAFGAVQTNKNTSSSLNLPINTLGYYNNPVFGKTKASFVTQLELATQNPTFGDSVHVKKVMLSIPYFAALTDRDDDGNSLYRLDSIRGNSKIKLEVFESGYYLRDTDASTGLQEPQKYFSDQKSDFDGNIGDPVRLNDSVADSQNDRFYFDPAEVVTYKTGSNGLQQVDKREGPQMQLSLRRDFFREKIFGLNADGSTLHNTDYLFNNNAFKQYFRGLYFKVDNADDSPLQGSMAQINFGGGKITITYSVLTNRKYTSGDNIGQYVVDEHNHREREDKTYVLNLKGNTVNLLENENDPTYLSAINNPDPVNGDKKLYLKGGAGSMAVIELFTPDELAALRNENWMINEANLTFNIDKTAMGSAPEPNRIYLYDLQNRRPLADYYIDATAVASDPKFNKYVHGGIIEKNDDGRGIRYRIRLTNHIQNLLKHADSTNVKLGLVVTESINNVSNAMLKSQINDRQDRVPAAAVANPLGTILYGSRQNDADIPEEKRLKLVIYYTKRN